MHRVAKDATAWSVRDATFSMVIAGIDRDPARAHAVLRDTGRGAYLVSVRAPQRNPRGADALCLRFPTGGGRASAGGIDALPQAERDFAWVEVWVEKSMEQRFPDVSVDSASAVAAFGEGVVREHLKPAMAVGRGLVHAEHVRGEAVGTGEYEGGRGAAMRARSIRSTSGVRTKRSCG